MKYAGIGSRETPHDVLLLMAEIAAILDAKGCTLRSGGANGADAAFASKSMRKWIFTANCDIPEWAMQSVDKYHPNPVRLSPYARRLHARNAMIVLGKNGDDPVNFIICWTKDGKQVGGTAQALRIAEDLGIKVFNLGDQNVLNVFLDRVKEVLHDRNPTS